MNVCVVGGGHIGTTLSAYIKQSYPEYSVKLMTRRPERFGEAIKVNDIEGGFSYDVALDAISADPSIAAAQADIVICTPVLVREAKEQNKSFRAHLAHLLVHSTLHAQGWDHETDEEAEEMEAREREIMHTLGFPNPYSDRARGH